MTNKDYEIIVEIISDMDLNPSENDNSSIAYMREKLKAIEESLLLNKEEVYNSAILIAEEALATALKYYKISYKNELIEIKGSSNEPNL